MSELDLDALAETVERAKAENFDSLAFSMNTVVIDRLIQRLREAEAEIPQLKEQLTFQELDLRNADQRLTEMAQTFGGQASRIERYEARIAQLERVREAASHAATDLDSAWRHGGECWICHWAVGDDFHEPSCWVPELRAALAAVEELVKR